MSCPAGFSTSRRAPYADLTETLVPGQKMRWWDFDITWSEKHFRASQLEPLRQVGDVLADRALDALDIKPGQDALELLREYTSRPIEDQPSDAPRKLLEQVMTIPEWVDWAQIQRGQDVYWKYILYISHTLLHFALAGGFAIPKIGKVLNATGYLGGSRTNERILDTKQFLLDIMQSPESIYPGFGHTGWESIIQVRFLHAGVRRRLDKISRAHSKYYNVQEHGVAINQEDLLATLFSFSNTMWRVMETRLDAHMPLDEREDYLHVWRYVGYLIGINDHFLSATTSPQRADACLESIVLHITDPDEQAGKMCVKLLRNFAALNRPGRFLSYLGLPDPVKLQMAMAEDLLGPSFWADIRLPHMSPGYRIITIGLHRVLAAELWMSSRSPAWAQRLRRSMISGALTGIKSSLTGRDRTQFELKALPKDGGALSALEKEDIRLLKGHSSSSSSLRNSLWPKLLTAASAALGVALVLAQRA
ncbi:hypothetical protein BG004_007794 [Podila humilis]|nr:hypothetical protein BG004_007794 [Podila humilis]